MKKQFSLEAGNEMAQQESLEMARHKLNLVARDEMNEMKDRFSPKSHESRLINIIDSLMLLLEDMHKQHEEHPNRTRWEQALIDLEEDYPSGAWGATSGSGGIALSRSDVDTNLKRIPSDSYISNVAGVATEYGLPTAFLLAIFCRESNHGHALDAKGEGDNGHAFGVGQVDGRYHEQAGRPNPYSLEHMWQCAGILVTNLMNVRKKHPEWEDKYILKGAAVAYNSGLRNVQTVEKMDAGTTHNNYGADVLARAKYYFEKGY